MARAVFEEWGLAHAMHEFKSWLDQGAPSADADEGSAADLRARVQMINTATSAVILKQLEFRRCAAVRCRCSPYLTPYGFFC